MAEIDHCLFWVDSGMGLGNNLPGPGCEGQVCGPRVPP